MISLETTPETQPPISIGGQSPEEMFKDSEHVMHTEFLQTGESDSILIRMDSTVILVDTADSDEYAVLKAKLAEHEITTIDYLIITHFDNDHIGSAAGIIKDFAVKNVYAPDYVRDSGLYRSMMAAIESRSGITTLHRVTGCGDHPGLRPLVDQPYPLVPLG